MNKYLIKLANELITNGDGIQGLLKSSSARAVHSVHKMAKKRTAENILETASNMKDAHDGYRSGKKKYAKLKKKVRNGYK